MKNISQFDFTPPELWANQEIEETFFENRRIFRLENLFNDACWLEFIWWA